MNTNLPQLDLPRGFVVGNEITETILNFYTQTCRLKAGIFVLCAEGTLHASINLTEYTLKPNDLITLMPGSIIQFCGQQESVRLSFIGFSSTLMEGINMYKSNLSLLPIIYENPIITLSEERASFVKDFLHLLERLQATENVQNPEIVKCILMGLIHSVSDLYKDKTWPSRIMNRSDEIHQRFIQLVMKHYTEKRQTSFYASQLSISPQHLCMVIKQKTGRSVSDIIADMVIMDAKSQLKATDLTIQEVSYSLNFPNVSFFGKYFKRYVGMSPQKYRNS